MPAVTQGGDILKHALRRPGGVAVFWFALGAPALIELSLPTGPDAIVLDLQHGLFSRASLEAAMARREIPTVVRVADGTATAIGQALDAGAEGVLVPLVESAEMARAAVGAAHYPPRGQRSGGGVRPLARGFARYVADAATRTVVGVMIETVAGVEKADAIASVPGVDFLFIGTGDLALSLGCFPDVDHRHEEACRRILDASRRAGVPCGIFTTSTEDAARRRREGYAMVVVANDIGLVASGFAAAQAAFRAGADEAAA